MSDVRYRYPIPKSVLFTMEIRTNVLGAKNPYYTDKIRHYGSTVDYGNLARLLSLLPTTRAFALE